MPLLDNFFASKLLCEPPRLVPTRHALENLSTRSMSAIYKQP